MPSLFSSYKYHAAGRQGNRPWTPGVWKNFPLQGFLALLGAVLCAVAAAVVLALSDGQPINNWQVRGVDVQPTVLLSIFSTLANAMLAYAFSAGVTIAWWTKALRGGTLAGLHHYWDYSQSTWAVATSGSHFSSVAFASLLLTTSLINGPLLQRASTVGSVTTRDASNLTLAISPDPFIPGATGAFSTHEPISHPSLFNPLFNEVVQNYNSRMSINVTTGCNGNCNGTIIAAGWVSVHYFYYDPALEEGHDQGSRSSC